MAIGFDNIFIKQLFEYISEINDKQKVFINLKEEKN